MQQQCFFCGHLAEPVQVHGHYQCAVCHTNILPCCDGDNCDTNNLLQQKEVSPGNTYVKAGMTKISTVRKPL